MFEGAGTIGVTAGASAPEVLVQEVIEFLKSKGYEEVVIWGDVREKIQFALPRELEEHLLRKEEVGNVGN